MYADDLVSYLSSSDWPSLREKITADWMIIYNLTLCNRLTINFDKTELQLFANKHRLASLKLIKHIDMSGRIISNVKTYI